MLFNLGDYFFPKKFYTELQHLKEMKVVLFLIPMGTRNPGTTSGCHCFFWKHRVPWIGVCRHRPSSVVPACLLCLLRLASLNLDCCPFRHAECVSCSAELPTHFLLNLPFYVAKYYTLENLKQSRRESIIKVQRARTHWRLERDRSNSQSCWGIRWASENRNRRKMTW